MMEGFGIHTFKLVDAKGAARFVKFHWKPLLGVHSLLWDEAVKISGKDPDFHRRDLWEAIEAGAFPEWELGLQIIPEADEDTFDFDLPGHVVPGIDFTNDPLLQGRLFSYTDTQLLRLGGPNFHEIPIDRPVAPLHNNQRDGLMRQTINTGRAAYHPNTIGGGCPVQAGRAMGGFVTHPQVLEGRKVRERGEKFFDHFSQATLFWNSQSEPEKRHIVQAFQFELGKLDRPAIRERMVAVLAQVDRGLATQVADGLGLTVPAKPDGMLNHSVPADGDPKDFQPIRLKQEGGHPGRGRGRRGHGSESAANLDRGGCGAQDRRAARRHAQGRRRG